jgi:hypothetical protein
MNCECALEVLQTRLTTGGELSPYVSTLAKPTEFLLYRAYAQRLISPVNEKMRIHELILQSPFQETSKDIG